MQSVRIVIDASAASMVPLAKRASFQWRLMYEDTKKKGESNSRGSPFGYLMVEDEKEERERECKLT